MTMKNVAQRLLLFAMVFSVSLGVMGAFAFAHGEGGGVGIEAGSTYRATQAQSSIWLTYTLHATPGMNLTLLNSATNDVKPGFVENFNIHFTRLGSFWDVQLNARPGCTRPAHMNCAEPACGPNAQCHNVHHRSLVSPLYANLNNRLSPRSFRFVNFPMCGIHAGSHIFPLGAATGVLGMDMIVSELSPRIRVVIAHEISHLLGARDGDCPTSGTLCVMNPGTALHDVWCNPCRQRINARNFIH